MITEDYVSFEIAKLLKEKGFPQEYNKYHSMVYNEEDYENEYEVQRMVLETEIVKAGTLSSYPVGVPEPKCYCPTLQMAMKWLREDKKILISIFCHIDKGYWFCIQHFIESPYKFATSESIHRKEEILGKLHYYDTYETTD